MIQQITNWRLENLKPSQKKIRSSKSKAPVKKTRTRKNPAAEKDLGAGADLFNQLVRLTGIPSKTIRKELKGIMERKGVDLDNLTMDQLRGVVASYLREIMSGLLDRNSHRRHEMH